MLNKPNKHSQPIRNLKGFLNSYLASESGKRALNRQPRMTEKSAKDSKNQVLKWKEPVGYNSMAHALAGLVHG